MNNKNSKTIYASRVFWYSWVCPVCGLDQVTDDAPGTEFECEKCSTIFPMTYEYEDE